MGTLTPLPIEAYALAAVEFQTAHPNAKGAPGTHLIDHIGPCSQAAEGVRVDGPVAVLGWPCRDCFTVGPIRVSSVEEPERRLPSGDGSGSAAARPRSDAPTDAQVRLLTALARGGFTAKAVEDVEASTEAWVARKVAEGRRACSAAIDAAKAAGHRPVWEPAAPEAPVEQAPRCSVERAAAPASSYVPERGSVHVVDGRYLRVSVSRSSGRPYVTEWGGYDWPFVPGGVRLLSEATVATPEQAAAFGAAYSKCVFCTRDLDTPESISVGYGPVCAGKHGLPWGEKPDAEPAAAAPAEAPSSPAPAVCGRHGVDLDTAGRCWECSVEADVAERDREEG